MEQGMRILRDRVSRRKTLGLLGGTAAGVGAFSLVGCGDDDDSEPTEAPDQSAEPNATATQSPAEPDLTAALTVAISADLGSMDPHAATAGNQLADTHLFNPPIAIAPGSGETVGFACDWEWSENNDAVLLTLKEGITFHDGTPLTVEDVKFSLDRITEKTDYNPDFVSARKTFFSSFGEASITDSGLVRIEAARPDASMPNTLRLLSLVPQALILEVGDEAFAQQVIGTGPMKFVSRTPDEEIQMERFDDYWVDREAEFGPRLPYVASVKQIIRPELQARVAALEAGEVDVAVELSPDLGRQIEGSDDLHVFYAPEGQPIHVTFNTLLETDARTGGPNPWKDLRVRQAVNHAVDVDALMSSVLTGKEKRAFGLNQGTFGFPAELLDRPYEYDPDLAKQLLSEAGYPDGFETDFHVGVGRLANSQEVSEAVAGFLAEVGIQCHMNVLPQQQFFEGVLAKNLPGIQHGAADTSSEPTVSFYALMRSTGVLAHSVDPALGIDELIDSQAAEFDAEARQQIIGEIITKWYDNAMWLFLYETVRVHAAKRTVEWPFYGSVVAYPEYWNMRVVPDA